MPRPPLYDEALRAELIRHAAIAIAAGGVPNLSLRAVATAAGTSTNAVYTLFGDKEGLVLAAVQTAAAGFTAAQRAVGITDDPSWDLYGLGQAYRAWAVAHPELYAVILGGRVPMPPPQISSDEVAVDEVDADDDPATHAIHPLAAAVTRMIDAGLFVGGTPEEVTLSIWASVHGIISLEIAMWPDRSAEEKDAIYRAQLLSIMRAWSAPE